jgi:hypothetical protein
MGDATGIGWHRGHMLTINLPVIRDFPIIQGIKPRSYLRLILAVITDLNSVGLE